MSAVTTPSVLARRMNRAFLEARLDELEVLIDDKAEIASFLEPEQILRGRDAIMDASRRAREASIFSVTLYTVRSRPPAWRSVRAAFAIRGTTRSRPAKRPGCGSGRKVGSLRSVHYPSEGEALAHYDPEADDFELP